MARDHFRRETGTMTIYCIYDCDEWKSRDSMRLICVCDDEHKADMLHAIQRDHSYTDEDMETYIFVEEMKLNDFC